MFGCEHAKGTTFIYDTLSAAEMAPAAGHDCVHASHVAAAGEDEYGNSTSELAGEYVPRLCDFLAAVLTGAGAEAVRAVAAEAARIGLQAAGAAEVASAAVAPTAGAPPMAGVQGAVEVAGGQMAEPHDVGDGDPPATGPGEAGGAGPEEIGAAEAGGVGATTPLCTPGCGSCALRPKAK